LLAVYETAAAGSAGVAMVLGEAGIGKTRLLQELAAAARRHGALVLFGRCLEGAWVPPYQAFVEAITGYAAQAGATRLRAELGPAGGPLTQLVPGLRELLPDVPTAEPLQPEEERLRLLDAVARFLAGLSTHGPVVLVLDDLQWADASTLVTLRHIARVLVGHRLLLVGAYRSGEVGPELVDALGALRTETEVTAVHLHGLAADALGRMLGALAAAPVSAALADTIQRETRGNPFFAREVLRHLLETQAIQLDADGALHAGLLLEAVPEGLRDVLARRRARLTPDANRFLDVAAGFDGPFPFAVVAEVAELEDAAALAALDEVLDSGLIEADVAPERYQFAHALIRHAVYADLNPSRRVRLHRKLAHALEAARAASTAQVAPAEVAAHYHQSAVLPGADVGVASALAAAPSRHRRPAPTAKPPPSWTWPAGWRRPETRGFPGSGPGSGSRWPGRCASTRRSRPLVPRPRRSPPPRVVRRPPAISPRSPRPAPTPAAPSMPGSWRRRDSPTPAGAAMRSGPRWRCSTWTGGRPPIPGIQGSSWTCPSATRRWGSCTAPGP
jgi:predicted ATPase